MATAKIKKGDKVVVLSGKDKGKTGEVVRAMPKENKVVVSGINVATRQRFFDGRPVLRGTGEPLPDIVWFKADGTEMTPSDWDSGLDRSVGIYLNGNGIRERDERGQPVVDDSFLLYFNADDVDVEFTIPSDEYAVEGAVLVDTAGAEADSVPRPAGALLTVQAKSLVILQEHSAPEPEVDHSVAASLASLAATVSGVPATTTSPPFTPPPGPKSTTQSAVLMTSRLCSITTTVLPWSARRWRTSRSLRTSSKWRPVVGSSRM